MAWAKTVAVVVPSPAMSLVVLATSRTICAPMFSKRFASSISLATVTPSLVDSGEPNDLSRTTLRPRGPRVIFTVLASLSIPRWMSPRAVVPKCKCFADIVILLKYIGVGTEICHHGRYVSPCCLLLMGQRARKRLRRFFLSAYCPSYIVIACADSAG